MGDSEQRFLALSRALLVPVVLQHFLDSASRILHTHEASRANTADLAWKKECATVCSIFFADGGPPRTPNQNIQEDAVPGARLWERDDSIAKEIEVKECC